MKKLLFAVLMIMTTSVYAQHHGYGHGYRGPHYGWVAPVIIGGAIGYGLSRYYNPPVVIQQTPVYIPTTPVTTCSEWREVVQPDGRIVRERTCYQQ